MGLPVRCGAASICGFSNCAPSRQLSLEDPPCSFLFGLGWANSCRPYRGLWEFPQIGGQIQTTSYSGPYCRTLPKGLNRYIRTQCRPLDFLVFGTSKRGLLLCFVVSGKFSKSLQTLQHFLVGTDACMQERSRLDLGVSRICPFIILKQELYLEKITQVTDSTWRLTPDALPLV